MDRLSTKARLAKELGISYGRLTALIESGEISLGIEKKKPEPVRNGRVCKECETPLVGKQRQYCSDGCRIKAEKRKYYHKHKKENGLTCLKCGKSLRGQQTRFCSPECKRSNREFKGVTIPCKVCGKPVTGKRRYCSDRCRDIGNGHMRKGVTGYD